MFHVRSPTSVITGNISQGVNYYLLQKVWLTLRYLGKHVSGVNLSLRLFYCMVHGADYHPLDVSDAPST